VAGSPGASAPPKPAERQQQLGEKPTSVCRGIEHTAARSPRATAGQPPALLPAAALPPAGPASKAEHEQNGGAGHTHPTHCEGRSLGAPPQRVGCRRSRGRWRHSRHVTARPPRPIKPPRAAAEAPRAAARGPPLDQQDETTMGFCQRQQGDPTRRVGAECIAARLGGGARPFRALTVLIQLCFGRYSWLFLGGLPMGSGVAK